MIDLTGRVRPGESRDECVMRELKEGDNAVKSLLGERAGLCVRCRAACQDIEYHWAWHETVDSGLGMGEFIIAR